jgi:hypothetical protein
MNKRQAFLEGSSTGWDIGLNVPASEWGGGKPTRDEFLQAVGEVEEHARQFSPFEMFAHEINSHSEFRAEGLWEAYDAGVMAGARRAFARRFGRSQRRR